MVFDSKKDVKELQAEKGNLETTKLGKKNKTFFFVREIIIITYSGIKTTNQMGAKIKKAFTFSVKLERQF